MLRELAAKAKAINIDELALEVARNNRELILNRNREQLTVGENARGQDVGKYKSDRYARMKKNMGNSAPFGVPDLKLSGALHEQMNVEIKPKSFDIDSKVEYSKYQIQRYGKEIYGLQTEAQQDIKFKNSKDIVRRYSQSLGI